MIYAAIMIFTKAFLFSLLLNRFFIWFSYRINFLDIPLQLARKNHKKSTPLLGGPAIFISFFSTIFLSLYIAHHFKSPILQKFPELLPYFKGASTQLKTLMFIFIASSLILFLGLKDDKDGMNPIPKLLGLILISLLLFYLNIRITLFINFPFISFFITLFWIIAVTNSFNLLDNMNGSCALFAISSSISLLFVASVLKQYFICFYLLAFLAVLIGFLRYNFFTGSIFLGDSGALFTGLNLAIITILESFYIAGTTTPFSTVLPLFIFFLPFYDTFSVIYIRIKNKKPIYKGDLNHITHRINRYGFSKKNSVLFLSLVNLIIGIGASLYLLHFQTSLLKALVLFFMTFFSVAIIEKIISNYCNSK